MEIICIDDKFEQRFIDICPNRPIINNIYTIREIRKTVDGETGLLLNEIENSMVKSGMFSFEPGFSARRFTTLEGKTLTEEMVRKERTSEKILVPIMPKRSSHEINPKKWGEQGEEGVWNMLH